MLQMKWVWCDCCKDVVCVEETTVIRCPFCSTDLMNEVLHEKERSSKVDDYATISSKIQHMERV